MGLSRDASGCALVRCNTSTTCLAMTLGDRNTKVETLRETLKLRHFGKQAVQSI